MTANRLSLPVILLLQRYRATRLPAPASTSCLQSALRGAR